MAHEHADADTQLHHSLKPIGEQGSWTAWIMLLLVLVVVVGLGSLLVYAWPLERQGDLAVYYGYAQAMWHSSVPYRDFALEYPPGVLPFILLAWPLGEVAGGYIAGYLVLSMLAVIIPLRHIYKSYGTKGVAATVTIIIPIVPLVFYCLDVFAAAALYAALVMFRKSWRWAAVLLAIAVLTKGYPIVCLPMFLIALPPAKIWGFLRYFGATLAIAIAPFVVISPVGMWHAVTYHSGRPVQLESGLAMVGYIEKLFGQPVYSFVSHKSWAIAFPGSKVIALAGTVLMVVSLALLCYWLYRNNRSAIATEKQPWRDLVLGCLAALLLFVLCFKVGSPQYIVPIFAVGAVVAQRLGSRARLTLTLRFFAISLVIYFALMNYTQLRQLQAGAMAFVVIRYILLAELLVWTLRKLRTKTTKLRPGRKR